MAKPSTHHAAWYMTAEHCPITGLPVSCPEVPVNRRAGSSYRVEMAKLGERIFLVKASGYVRAVDMTDSLSLIDRFLSENFNSEKNVVLIEDYSDVKGAETDARKQYVDYFRDHRQMMAGVLYNMPPLFKISYHLAVRLQFFDAPLYAVSDYSQAISVAMQIIDQAPLGSPPPSGKSAFSASIPNRFSIYATLPDFSKALAAGIKDKFKAVSLRLLSRFNQALTRQYAERLLDYIQSIDWQHDGVLPAAGSKSKSGDQSLNQVFEAIGYVKFEIDRLINEKMAAEQELKASEQRYRQVVEHAKAAIMELDIKTGRMESFNDVLSDITGYTREEIMSMTVFDMMTEESRKNYMVRYNRLLAGESISPDVTYQLITKSGDMRWVLINTNRTFLDGHPYRANVVLSDVTEMKRIEAKLLEYQVKLKGLSIQISKTQESERRMLASRLHDSVSQELFAAQLQLNALENKIGEAEQLQRVREIKGQIQKVIRDTKSLTFDLSPPVLYDFGLEEALTSLAGSVGTKYGIPVKTWFSGDLDKIDDEIKIILYRVLNELIQNTVKHARAKEIRISLNNAGHLITMDVEDDGIGFDAENLHTEAASYEGFGLFDIREKMQHLGGSFTIDSRPGAGTAIMVEVPMGDKFR